MVTGKGNFAGSGQVQIICRQVVNLIGVLTKEASALHYLWLDQGWGDQSGEASFGCLL